MVISIRFRQLPEIMFRVIEVFIALLQKNE